MYFILNNSNGELYDEAVNYGPKFVATKIDSIESKLNQLSGISLSVSILILLSGFIIIPLFGKI